MNKRYTAVFFALAAGSPAFGQVYPTKPVHIIVPAATGGPGGWLAGDGGQFILQRINTLANGEGPL